MGMEVPVSNAVTETEVRVSGADTGVVVPVRVAVTTATTLSEADIIVNRVVKNLQPPVASGTPVCPVLTEGEGDTVVPLLWCVCVWGGGGGCESGLCVSQVWVVEEFLKKSLSPRETEMQTQNALPVLHHIEYVEHLINAHFGDTQFVRIWNICFSPTTYQHKSFIQIRINKMSFPARNNTIQCCNSYNYTVSNTQTVINNTRQTSNNSARGVSLSNPTRALKTHCLKITNHKLTDTFF